MDEHLAVVGAAARSTDLLNEASMVRSIHRAIQKTAWRSVAQPILSLRTGAVVGYEALTRPDATASLSNPADFLAAAGRVGLAAKVDELWRRASIERFAPVLPEGASLFLNVAPSVLLGQGLRAPTLAGLVRAHGLSPDRVVLELTEEESVADFGNLRVAFGAFRSEGFMVAIDDVGAGPSTLQAIAELRPNFIKLDRWLATDIAFDGARRSIVESMVELAHRTRASVIAEGIETEAQLRALTLLGVDLAQGYWLGRPSEDVVTPPPGRIQLILSLAGEAAAAARTGRRLTVADLASTALILPSTATGAELLGTFESDDALHEILIADELTMVGIVTRDRLLRRFAEQFGNALHSRKPASALATAATMVGSAIEAREAARLALARPRRSRQDPLVVMAGRSILGVVGVLDLVEAVLEDEVNDARQANPLTGLPGNTSIRSYLVGLGESLDEVLLYIDIDNFKRFNDSYGFGAGDLAISKLGSMLQEISYGCSVHSFVGHIGGDDFVFAAHSADLPYVRSELAKRLAARWYDPDNLTDCRRLTVTVGGAFLRAIGAVRYEDRAAAVARIKTGLKAQGGGRMFVLGDPRETADRAFLGAIPTRGLAA